MAAVGKKKMKAVLKVKPLAEMHKKTEKWIRSDMGLMKIFLGHIQYTEEVTLDPRKWNPGSLSKALQALVRYELKLLDQAAMDVMKDWEDADDKTKKKLRTKIEKSYKDLVKKMHDKCSLALEEVEADKGDNKKGLRDGKAALGRLQSVNVDKVLSAPRTIILTALGTLNAELFEAEKLINSENYNDQKKGSDAADKAAKKALKQISASRQVLAGNAKDCKVAIKFLNQTAKNISKNDETNPKLDEFGKMIEKYQPDLARFLGSIDRFEDLVSQTEKMIQGKNVSAFNANAFAGYLRDAKKMEKDANKVQSALTALRKKFGEVEKELK